MKINVQYITNPLTSNPFVCVNVDGICNHADTDFEEEEFDTYNPHGPDSSYTETIETCNKCKSYRTVWEDDASEWRGIQVMPL